MFLKEEILNNFSFLEQLLAIPMKQYFPYLVYT